MPAPTAEQLQTYRGLRLDPFQQQAIAALEAGRSVLVAAPTGTGKTIIADWIVDEALSIGREVIYTAPIKALSNQKFRDYTRLHGERRVGLVTGDLVIRRDAPCRVMTTEILRNMLLSREPLRDLRAVILDEIHFLDDRERGTVWEEVLIYLPKHVQIVGLSATLSNLDEFAGWLAHVRETEVEVVQETRRAVPLTYHCFSVDTGLVDLKTYDRKARRALEGQRPAPRDRRERGGRRGRPARKTGHLDVFRVMRDEGLLPYLYFVFSRRDTESLARSLGRFMRDGLLDPERQARMDARLERAAAEIGPALDPELRALYAKGIAFHHAGLHVLLKALVEELYEERLIDVLYCTSTFALGINMPARSVVFDGLEKFDGKRVAPLTTRQFMQKAGRAGRRGMDRHGHVVIRMDVSEYRELKPHLQRYTRGEPEPVRSSFGLSWNSIVNLLAHQDLDQIREIVDKSFLNWHLTRRAVEDVARAEELQEGDVSRRERREAKRLRRRAAQAEGRCWAEFEERARYLQAIGYLDEDFAFQAGANVLRHLQISEIFVSELVLSGLLEDLEPAELFGVLCAMTNELPRRVSVDVRFTPSQRRLIRAIQDIRYSDAVVDAEELTDTEYDWDPDLLPLGKAWAEGRPLQEILEVIHSETDVAGDLITGFRRAKDLVSQLRDVYAQIPDRRDMLDQLIRTVSRDEVEVVD